MSGFGNYLGALSGEYDDSWIYDPGWAGTTESHALVDEHGKLIDIDQLERTDAAPDKPFQPKSVKLGQIPGLTSDDDTYQEISAGLHGAKALNWEDKTFQYMKDEKDKLDPSAMTTLANAWKQNGDDLKSKSEAFKTAVQKNIAGNWSGASAEAADAATAQVTKTSIYDFTPASDEISNRLKALSEAFTDVRSGFPNGDNLFKNGDFDLNDINNEVRSFNDRYHLDGSGRLRNNTDGYVAASTAYDQMQMIKRSTSAYQEAVRRFRDIYNGAILTVADNFPMLPPPPDMTYKPAGDPGGPGAGPGTGPGGGPGGGTPSLGGMPALKNNTDAIKPFDPKALDTDLKNPKLPITNLPDTQTTEPTTSAGQNGLSGLTGPLGSAVDAAKDAIGQAMDAAKGAGQGGLPDPNLGGPQGPPEGVLGLGPQGLGGGAAGTGGGGVGGAGSMPKSLAIGKTVDSPAVAAAKAPAAAAGAGLASGAGSPGAGAPAAGQRGGDQGGKSHQVNKALRRKKNGKDVIGDAEGAVAVVGAPENGEQPEGLHIEQTDRPDQPDPANPNGGPAPRRVPRPRQPMQMPGL